MAEVVKMLGEGLGWLVLLSLNKDKGWLEKPYFWHIGRK
jgi:hypothetical protein